MPKATRIGDGEKGICDNNLPDCPHIRLGVNTIGSQNVFINGSPAHRKNDFGDCHCPHSGSYVSSSGSSTVFINGRSCTRVGDVTTCTKCSKTGIHIEGSSNVIVGG